MSDGVEMLSQHPRLVVKAAAAHVLVDLLQADQVGVLLLDYLNHASKVVAAVAPADSFVNVVAQQPHAMARDRGGRKFSLRAPADTRRRAVRGDVA